MLANLSLGAASQQKLYTCNATTRTVGELSLCNPTTGAVKVRVAIATGANTPSPGQYLEYDRVIGASAVAGNGPLTRSIMLLPNQALWVYSDTAGVNAVLTGIEE